MQKKYLAIDIGASSGRHIVGWMENGVLRTEEVYRFPNSVQRVDGHLEWDIDSLFANVKNGIREAFAWELRVALPDQRVYGMDLGPDFVTHGAQDKLYKHCGLDEEAIVKLTGEVLKG